MQEEVPLLCMSLEVRFKSIQESLPLRELTQAQVLVPTHGNSTLSQVIFTSLRVFLRQAAPWDRRAHAHVHETMNSNQIMHAQLQTVKMGNVRGAVIVN